MRVRPLFASLATALIVAALAGTAFLTRDSWLKWFTPDESREAEEEKPSSPVREAKVLQLSEQARKNLGLVSRPVQLGSYWRTIQIPGVIVDRPGHSDRGVTAPAVSVVVRVRLHVPVEQFKDVIVLPAGAVVREGPESYVFRQNGHLFDRWAVHVLHEDRLNVILANDGSVLPGWYLAQSAAASLNRVLKAQNSGGGLPPGAHFHADGSLHIPGQLSTC